ncbi:MAG: cell division ATP-binding protein FtsE [bacterium]|nr:cell division ATP-binding protein FtsE [bacterium]
MISFQEVTKAYDSDKAALENVSFEIEQGEFVSLVGKSGAGKTTVIRLLMAEERPTSGKVLFEGKNVAEISSSRLPEFRREIGAIFQDYKLLPFKTVHENVAYVMEVMGAEDKDIERDVGEVLEIVDLEDRKNAFPVQLSGGEKQRVAIARALIHRPRVLVADEPTGNLDPYHTEDIVRILRNINKLGTTVLLATHDKGVVDKLGKRVITLDEGRVVRDEEKGKFILS